jgi:hypothetical protein
MPLRCLDSALSNAVAHEYTAPAVPEIPCWVTPQRSEPPERVLLSGFSGGTLVGMVRYSARDSPRSRRGRPCLQRAWASLPCNGLPCTADFSKSDGGATTRCSRVWAMPFEPRRRALPIDIHTSSIDAAVVEE